MSGDEERDMCRRAAGDPSAADLRGGSDIPEVRGAGEHRLSCAADGELSAEAAHELAQHLASCPECAAELERFRQIRALLRRTCSAQSAPASLRERITVEYRRVSVSVRTQRRS